jgi:hypothetical protein
MRRYLSAFATVAALSFACQANAGMITADLSGTIDPNAGTGTLNIGTATITGIPGLNGSYATDATLAVLSFNAATGTGALSVTSNDGAFAAFTGTFANVNFGPPAASQSLAHLTADVDFNLPSGFPAGLPHSGSIGLDFFANSTVSGQLTLINVSPSAVPEPASVTMAGLGLAGSLIVFRRKRNRSIAA